MFKEHEVCPMPWALTYWCHELGLTRSRDVIDHWPIASPYAISYWCPTGTERLSSTVFKIFPSK